MEGFYYGIDDQDHIEKVNQKNAQLALLGKGDGTEVMLQYIEKDDYFGVSPSDSEVMEFFYIIEGSIKYVSEDEEIILNAGSYFYVYLLEQTVNFKAIEPVKLLYISSQPIFHFISNDIKKLLDISKQVEDKDVYTHNHADRVKKYAAGIGDKLGVSKAKFEVLCYSALLHDIGKIYVPDDILTKEGKLTDEEMDIIKKHPSDGRKVVEGTYLERMGKVIEQHHERFDGSGYPKGLKSDDILLEAKIIGIADSFDAMITDRPYRKAMDPEAAFTELNRLASTEIDRKIMAAFGELLREEGLIK